MFAPEEQQVEICILKSNLEEIENDLVVQRSALPELDAENEKRYRETMTALKVVRSLNVEMERLKQENVQLVAKRMQLKQQCNEISSNLEKATQNRDKLTDSLKQEEQEIEIHIGKYEDSLQEKADRFRRTRGYYNEEEINTEINKLNSVIAELKIGMREKQSEVDELSTRMDSIYPEIPQNLLDEIGKLELEEKLKLLTAQYEDLLKNKKP